MSNKYFDKTTLTVYTGDLALAQDLNDISNACEAGFAIVLQDFATIASDQANTITLASNWATYTGGLVPTQIDYSSKEYAIGDVTASGGSAKAWAIDASSPNGTTDKSAKTLATEAAASASTATTQAGIATTQAGIATTQAGTATTAASTATTQAGIATTQASDALASASAAAASYDSFDDRYLGAKASDPTLDNDGNALLTGALYWNTTTPNMRVYNGSTWTAAYTASPGDVVGPASATDSGLVAFDGTTGKLVKAANTVTVAQGGTGRTTGTTAYALIATGITATGAQQSLAAGATTEVLVGGGASALPVWTTATGSDAPVRATSPTLVTPALGTPSSGVLTNCTGTASGLTAGNVTTNANLTGEVTSVGNAATLTNSAVIGKVLTGYISGAGTVAATDTILQAVQKLNGNSVLKANIDSPALTGTPTAPTATVGTNTTQIATTAFVLANATGTTFASSAENAAGTVENKAVDPLGIREAFNATGSAAPLFSCRAWVSFNAIGTVTITGSGNVTSITDNGVGDFTINFTTALANSNFSSLLTGGRSTFWISQTTTTLQFYTTSGTFANTDFNYNCAAII